MRNLESEARRTQRDISIAQGLGYRNQVEKKTARLKAIRKKYNEIANGSGIKAQPEKMRMYKNREIGIAKGNNGGIIDLYRGKGIQVVENSGVAEEIQNRVKEATKTITNDFKSLEKYSEPIRFGKVDRSPAENVFDPLTGKNQITLDADNFANPDALLQSLKKDFIDRLSYDTDYIESLVAHEMGHNAHIALALKRSGIEYGKPLNRITYEIFETNFNKISQEIYEAAFDEESFQQIQDACTKDLGIFVFGNPKELVAQSFGNFYYGKDKSTIAANIVRYFMEGLK